MKHNALTSTFSLLLAIAAIAAVGCGDASSDA